MPALTRPQLAAYAVAAVVVVVLGMRFMQGQARGGSGAAAGGAQVARAPASVKIDRPASTGAQNIIGQAPPMTAIPCSRQNVTASGDTLVPARRSD